MLVVIVDLKEVRAFNDKFQFINQCPYGYCECCGYPGLDWYKGTNRRALTGLQHGDGLRWCGFPGDASLTEETSDWIVNWMVEHGIRGENSEFLERARPTTVPTDANAQFNMGMTYYQTRTLFPTNEYAAAAQWFMKAAEKGHSAAQWRLGLMYGRGEGVEKNYAVALKWHRCRAGQR